MIGRRKREKERAPSWLKTRVLREATTRMERLIRDLKDGEKARGAESNVHVEGVRSKVVQRKLPS